MIDLNNLKVLNDTFGHEEGDKALKTLASKVEQVLPYGCKFFRIGGDEFAVICYNTCKTDIKIISENIVSSSKETPYKWAAGYALVCENNNDLKETLNDADRKMYENKEKLKKK